MHRMLINDTGIEVSRLGLGGIPLQRIAEKEAIEVVSYAIERGIDFIDTARNYTVSESRIGKAMEQAGKKIIISSKSVDRTTDGIRRDIEKSMNELKVSHIDFYHCHSVGSDEDYSRVTAKDGALNGLLKAKEEGVIGHTGVSSYNVEVMEKIVDDNLFETIMVGFNIVEPIAYKSVIPKAMKKKRGIFIMKPLAGGVIGIPELAMRWALSFPGLIVITGMENKAEVDKNWGVLQGGYSFTDDEKQRIITQNREFTGRFCHRCQYCEPCTVNIPIYKILSIKNMVRIHGDKMLTRPDFEDTLERAKNCIECNDCLIRCPYNLPIPFMMKELVKWVDYERSRIGDAMY
ncbi:MAG: aldo/keto reductase [Deltaproteobacteria bacterium]|nr:aldo/keto reductase [Deltaproteobacteria bacterium]